MRNRSVEIFLGGYIEKVADPAFAQECRAVAGAAGEEFCELAKHCSHRELVKLSGWNMLSFAVFRQQTAIAQLGRDAISVAVVACQITNAQSALTRSHSAVITRPGRLLRPFRFLPMTLSGFLAAVHDAQLMPDPAPIRLFAGNARSTDIEARVAIARTWPELSDVMSKLTGSDLLQFAHDLPIDPLLWARPMEVLSFSAHFLYVTLDLSVPDLSDIGSVDLQLRLSSLVPAFFALLMDQLKLAIQTNSVQIADLILLKSIHILNRSGSDSLSLFRFLRSLLKRSHLQVNMALITALLCPNNALESKKFRRILGEPFCFKSEASFQLWQTINQYSQDLIHLSNSAFYAQRPRIIGLMSALIESQTKTAEIGTGLDKLRNSPIAHDTTISFIDESVVDDAVIEELRIVNLSTPYPSEMLQSLSIVTFLMTVLQSVTDGKPVAVPHTFGIPLDILALVDSYSRTGNFCDLSFAVFELVHHLSNGRSVVRHNSGAARAPVDSAAVSAQYGPQRRCVHTHPTASGDRCREDSRAFCSLL
jgi:hypothetical protein